MAIVKRPGAGSGKNIPVNEKEQAIEQFIAGSAGVASGGSQDNMASANGAAPEKIKKQGIMVYFDPQVLARVDQAAHAKGLSRSSWIHQKAIEALEENK